MADDDLIDRYLSSLQDSLRWHRDVDDLIVEVDDHLRCATDALVAAGHDPHTAQRQVIARFGDPILVSRSFALTSHGGIAMPTRFTRATGALALLGALAWTLGGGFALLRSDQLDVDWKGAYIAETMLVLVATTCTTLTLAGLLRRSGASRLAAGSALTLAVLGTVLMALAVWAWVVGVALLAVASLITVLRMRAQDIGPVAGQWLLVAAWPVAIGLALALDALQVGPVDGYGEYFLSQLIGFAIGCAITAVALVAIGRWLRSEEPVVVPESLATA